MTDCSQLKLLIFETHPIQYRAPVYQELQKICPNAFQVVYASDFSVRGYRDMQFGGPIKWDVPLLDGYSFKVLNNETSAGIDSWRGLTGRGVLALLRKTRPSAILLCSFGYRFSITAYLGAILYRIPIWIRMETQDDATPRTWIKSTFRSFLYRVLYLPVSRGFYIGKLNKAHLLRHGLAEYRLSPARYCTPDPMEQMPLEQKNENRRLVREELGIQPQTHVVAFFGKLIQKKDPLLLLSAMRLLPLKKNFCVLYVGSGDQHEHLLAESIRLERGFGVKVIFAGFVNQSKLMNFYLASDTVVLPSRRSGETWGLVVNEALQAGCNVVVSDAAGCQEDFGHWDRVRVVPVGDAGAAARALGELSVLPRDFDWARKSLPEYSVAAAAQSLAQAIAQPQPF